MEPVALLCVSVFAVMMLPGKMALAG